MQKRKEHILKGKTILKIEIADDKQSITFITNKGNITGTCYAECCSYSWIETVELPVAGFPPAKVLYAEDIPMPDLGDMPEREVVVYYGFKIVTDKGEILIDYRNDSNGYYGGGMSWTHEISDGYYEGRLSWL